MQISKKLIVPIFCLFLGQGHTQGMELRHTQGMELDRLPPHCPKYELIWENLDNLQEADNQVMWGRRNFQVIKIDNYGKCENKITRIKAVNYALSPKYIELYLDICSYAIKCDESTHKIIVLGVRRP